MATDSISGADTAWVLASTALVLFMTPGLAFYYGGLVKGENVLNTMMMSIISMGAVALPYYLVGFSLAFDKGNRFIGGFEHLGLYGLEVEVWDGLPALLAAAFHMTFVIVAASIISGAVVERMRFAAYAIFIVLWSLLVYAPVCHWVWGPGGWIRELGAKDFAGGTVVHEITAMSAFVLAILLGPRRGFRDASAKVEPHNVPFVILGASMLWFGWSGFNGGSAMGANMVAARAVINTYLSAAASLVVWAIIERAHTKHLSAVGTVTGAIVGLVIITPAAGFVTPSGAVLMGALGCALVYPVFQLNKTLVDDTLDCLPCHGASGFLGTVLTGLFATDGGLFYGGGWKLLGIQVVAALAPLGYAAAVSALIFGLMSCCMRMRVLEIDEAMGMDEAVHGEKAYTPNKPYPSMAPAPPEKPATESVGTLSLRSQSPRLSRHLSVCAGRPGPEPVQSV